MLLTFNEFCKVLFRNKILATIKQTLDIFYDNQNLMVPLEDRGFLLLLIVDIWIIGKKTNV